VFCHVPLSVHITSDPSSIFITEPTVCLIPAYMQNASFAALPTGDLETGSTLFGADKPIVLF